MVSRACAIVTGRECSGAADVRVTMGKAGYEKLQSTDEERAREAVPAVPRYAAALMAVATVGAAVYSPSARGVVARTTFAAGLGLEAVGSAVAAYHGAPSASLNALIDESCECGDADCAALDAMEESATAAPSQYEDWIVYFTNGVLESDGSGESYVWYMAEDGAATTTKVLLDTSGDVMGVTADWNNTWIYYTVTGAGVYKVLETGREVSEVASYSDGDLAGLDIDEYESKIYFADNATDGGIYMVDTDGGSEAKALDVPLAWGVAYDVHLDGGTLFVSTRAGAIYSALSADFPCLDATCLTTLKSDISGLGGLSVDTTTHELYYAADDGIYSMSSDGADATLVYSASGALDVAMDQNRDLLFYADESGLWEGSLSDSDTDAEQLAVLDDMHFVYVASVLPPTPAPTPVPSAGPSLAPTSAPSRTPTSKPTEVPAPVPTSLPTPVPVPLPSPVPSPMPSRSPTPLPTSKPTDVPAPAPTYAPSATPTPVPTPKPSHTPTSKPTALPTIVPSAVPVPAPSAAPVAESPGEKCLIDAIEFGCYYTVGGDSCGEAGACGNITYGLEDPTLAPTIAAAAPVPTTDHWKSPTNAPVATAAFLAPTAMPAATVSLAGGASTYAPTTNHDPKPTVGATGAPTRSPLEPEQPPPHRNGAHQISSSPTTATDAPSTQYHTPAPTLSPLHPEQPPPHTNGVHHVSSPPTTATESPSTQYHTQAPTLMPLPPPPPPPHKDQPHHISESPTASSY